MTAETATLLSESNAAPPCPEEDPQLSIGDRLIPSRYFLAPLAGYTRLPFRIALRELGGLGLATTDLVLATTIFSKRRTRAKFKSESLLQTAPADRPLSVQIYGGNAADLVAAARVLQDRGYRGIDINMGCPMAKINSSGGGARLMCDSDNACETVRRVAEAVDVPVTVKMRLGWNRDSVTAPVLAREFEKAGARAITIHGRTRQQGFHGSVDLEGIRRTVEAVEEIPVIGNGDVRSPADAFRMRRETGCAAVAIGRGAMLDPWIFRKIKQPGCSEQPGCRAESSPQEQIDFLVRHFYLMVEQEGERSCLEFRKFAAWYGARLGIPEDLENRLRRFESFREFDEIVEQIRARHGERETSVPTALIKVPNGPVERW